MVDAYKDAVARLSPELYRRFVTALEVGKWPDGSPLEVHQREHVMQAVIAYGELNLPREERIGYIDKGHKAGDLCDEEPLKWSE
jgi:uncharacterized protein YeaC (DUF1315 family)